MAKITGHHPALLDALQAMGIDTKNTQKVIIEISWDKPVVVHVQQVGTTDLVGVVKALDGDLTVVRESVKYAHGGPIDKGRLVLVGEGQPEEIAIPVQVTHSPSVSARRTGPGETTVTIHRGDPKEQE